MTEAVQPVHDRAALLQLQSLPLEAKVRMSINRIRQAYERWNGQVYVSVSGGLDSTVLAHIVRSIYPDVPLVFFNTGLEYPENQQLCRDIGSEFIRPKRTFLEVIDRVGYPVVSRRQAQYIGDVQAARRKGRPDAPIVRLRMTTFGPTSGPRTSITPPSTTWATSGAAACSACSAFTWRGTRIALSG